MIGAEVDTFPFEWARRARQAALSPNNFVHRRPCEPDHGHDGDTRAAVGPSTAPTKPRERPIAAAAGGSVASGWR